MLKLTHPFCCGFVTRSPCSNFIMDSMDISIACFLTYLPKLVSRGVITFKESFFTLISYSRFLVVRLLLMTILIMKKVCGGSILLVVVILVMPSSLWANLLPLGIDTICINLLQCLGFQRGQYWLVVVFLYSSWCYCWESNSS